MKKSEGYIYKSEILFSYLPVGTFVYMRSEADTISVDYAGKYSAQQEGYIKEKRLKIDT